MIGRIDLLLRIESTAAEIFFLKDFSPVRECSDEMKNETTRVRGRWDRRDSVLNEGAYGIFSAEQKNSPLRSDESGGFDPRATSVSDGTVLAIATAMNEFSSAMPAL